MGQTSLSQQDRLPLQWKVALSQEESGNFDWILMYHGSNRLWTLPSSQLRITRRTIPARRIFSPTKAKPGRNTPNRILPRQPSATVPCPVPPAMPPNPSAGRGVGWMVSGPIPSPGSWTNAVRSSAFIISPIQDVLGTDPGWLDNSAELSSDPRSGIRRRHHLSDAAVQQAVRQAAVRAGIQRRVTPHTLRHSEARATEPRSLRGRRSGPQSLPCRGLA